MASATYTIGILFLMKANLFLGSYFTQLLSGLPDEIGYGSSKNSSGGDGIMYVLNQKPGCL